MSSGMKILLADDDRDLIDLLRYSFQRVGYSVVLAFDGESALRMIQTELPDLVVLDLMMPRRNGMEVLKEMRRSSYVPVIVLTALGDEDHVVDALQLGADDYIVKPFRPRELNARAHALLRRSQQPVLSSGNMAQPIVIGDVSLNPSTRQVEVGERQVQLSRIEFSLLHYLMLNRNVVLSIGNIIANVWGYEGEENAEVVKVAVSRLRRKMEDDSANPRYIVNVPGVGYQFHFEG
jgi:DNA-binding response OmpR family regulator